MRKIFISIAILCGALAFGAPQQPVTAVSDTSTTTAKVVKYPAPAPAPAPVVYKTAQKVVFEHYAKALQKAIARALEAATKCKEVDAAPTAATTPHRVNVPKQEI